MKVRVMIKLIEGDGWRQCDRRGAIASFIIRPSQAP
jgi:predicted RNA binding protein YcfA (HicA-like mRNA interferase family)